MDDPSRTESYQQLVADMRKARCSVHVLDHNFNEVDGIITRAAGWANDTSYDLRKANNAARFSMIRRWTKQKSLNSAETLKRS